MKIKFVVLVIILIILICIFNVVSNNNHKQVEFKPLELEIGEEFTDIKYNNPMYIINYGISEVTGDNENDMIIVVGEKSTDPSDLFVNNMDVIVYDTANKEFKKAEMKKCNAIAPKFMFGDLDGDGINDIILITENEDTTKNIRILNVKNNSINEIYGTKERRELEVTGYFMNGFKAYISFKKVKYEGNLDLSNKKENYVTSGFYNEEGKVLTDSLRIRSSGFTSVELVEVNGQKGLKVTERVKGFDNLDILDQIQVLLKYENGSWNIKEAKGDILGNLLY